MAKTGTERRQHERAEIQLPATIERVVGRALAGPATTVDLSEGGARLVGPGGFAVGDVVRVSITGDDVGIEHQGLVVGRTTEKATSKTATLHVAFKSLDEPTTIDLRRLIGLD